jgi:hypothetical protein
VLLDLKAWQASHNMFVALNAELVVRDAALTGPAEKRASVSPAELRSIAVDADNCGLLADDVLDVVVEAANLAPEVPDPQDRRTIWSSETGRNLVIEAFNIAMDHPRKSIAGAVAAGAAVTTFGPIGTVVSLAAVTIPAAKFLLRHRQWIETRLGDSPTWRALFVDLSQWLEKNTPFGPNGDR